MQFNKVVDDYDHQFKLILLGDSGVGKTNILLRYTRNQFQINSQSTVGIEYSSKTIQLQNENKRIKLQLWDTGGQEKFRVIVKQYYQGAVGAFLVYDISKQESFDNINKWYQELKTYSEVNNMVLMLVGNKSDLENSRQVNRENAINWAEQNNMAFAEVSGMNGSNIEFIFRKMAEEIYKLLQMKTETVDMGSLADPINTQSKLSTSKLKANQPKISQDKSVNNCC